MWNLAGNLDQHVLSRPYPDLTIISQNSFRYVFHLYQLGSTSSLLMRKGVAAKYGVDASGTDASPRAGDVGAALEGDGDYFDDHAIDSDGDCCDDPPPPPPNPLSQSTQEGEQQPEPLPTTVEAPTTATYTRSAAVMAIKKYANAQRKPSSSTDSTECTVCLEDFWHYNPGVGPLADAVIELSCGHLYHRHCLAGIASKADPAICSLCPICRGTVK